MPLDIHTFTVHDIIRFPLCIVRNDVVVPGYGAQWEAEIEAVMAHGVPLVLIYLEPGDDEAHADRVPATEPSIAKALKNPRQLLGLVAVDLFSHRDKRVVDAAWGSAHSR